MRAARFDESRLVAYVRDALQKDGDDLVPTIHGRRTLWAARKDPALAGFFLDARTLVDRRRRLGGADGRPRPTAPPVPAAAPRPTSSCCSCASGPPPVTRSGPPRIVPAELRHQLERDPRFESAASVTRMSLGIGLGAGLDAAFTADLADPSEAKVLVAKCRRDACRGPSAIRAC